MLLKCGKKRGELVEPAYAAFPLVLCLTYLTNGARGTYDERQMKGAPAMHAGFAGYVTPRRIFLVGMLLKRGASASATFWVKFYSVTLSLAIWLFWISGLRRRNFYESFFSAKTCPDAGSVPHDRCCCPPPAVVASRSPR